MLRVYLAGPVRDRGRRAWRDDFVAALDHALGGPQGASGFAVRCIHPGGNLPPDMIPEGEDGPEPEGATPVYVPADLLSIRRCDVLVAFLTDDGAQSGTMVELGYALGLGKTILAILEGDAAFARRFALGSLGGQSYTLAGAAATVVYMARQEAGATWDPEQPG